MFVDLADSFIRSFLQAGHAFNKFKHTDINRYYETSIKMEPRRDERRFPANQKNDWNTKWENLFCPTWNKKQSWHCPCYSYYQHQWVDKTILAGGAFSDATETESPNPNKDRSHLEASHEEVDTKVFLHWIIKHPAFFLLLVVHFDKIKYPKIWI